LASIVIEAEVRYAVRHEYALTATDVIARRIRLSFLNAQAAAEALLRIVDIMAEELNWSTAHKQEELAHTTRFLRSTGLPPGAALPVAPFPLYRSWWEWALSKIDGTKRALPSSISNGRAQFAPGEVDALREAFVERSQDPAGRLGRVAIRKLLLAIPTYASIRTKDYDYVLEETGLVERDIDVDEFVEVRPLNAVLCAVLLTGLYLWVTDLRGT
jgi:glycerol-3-phosphate dehydrogenase